MNAILTETNINVAQDPYSPALQVQIISSTLFYRVIGNIFKPSLKKYKAKHVLYIPDVAEERII